jgi:hypothetical protein
VDQNHIAHQARCGSQAQRETTQFSTFVASSINDRSYLRSRRLEEQMICHFGLLQVAMADIIFYQFKRKQSSSHILIASDLIAKKLPTDCKDETGLCYSLLPV